MVAVAVHGLRQATWKGWGEDERQQHEDLATVYPDVIETHHPLYRPRIHHSRTSGECRWRVEGYDAETHTVFLSFWRVSDMGDPYATDSEWKSAVVWMTAEWGKSVKLLL